MENKQQIVNELAGINELEPQTPSHLSELVNWKTDDITGGWSSKLGYEMYFTYRNDWVPFQSMAKVDSLFYFNRHQGAQDSILFEAGGVLYHLFEHGATPTKQALVSDRTIPGAVEQSTQYLPFGQFVCIVNGYDKPIKYRAWPVVQSALTFNPAIYPLGFHKPPGTPIAWGVAVNPTALSKTATSHTCIQFGSDHTLYYDHVPSLGLGIDEADKKNKYRWKVTYINNAGAESPLSSSSEVISWTTAASSSSSTGTFRYACAIEIPIGDNDIIARRIYRTKNYSSDGGNSGDVFYYVTDVPNNFETLFIDSTPDIGLGSTAPSKSDSIVFPSIDCRFTGIYKDCLFIDGGRTNDTVIYYSNPTKPDQYQALNFITVGNRQGGGITGFFGYFGYMLVFRENSIDVIQGDFPNFVATPFQQHIGTRAIDTVTMVPGLGVVFLTVDGVYAVGGNLEYSDTTNVKKISHGIQETISRMNVTNIAQATAVYSEKHREWHCYFCVDGSSINNIGIIFHTDKQVWSVREGFPVNNIVKNPDGDLIFGRNGGAASNDDPAGLFVISKRRSLGQKISEGNIIDEDPPTSTMASAWLDMGDPSFKKKVHGVYLFIRTGGDTTVSMDIYRDYDYNTYSTTTGVKLQRADFADQNVYDLVKLDDDKFWEEPMVTPIRFDVHNGSCSWFRWRIQTTVDVIVIGYAVDYTVSGTRIIAGKRLS
jgi:hypothetical protein